MDTTVDTTVATRDTIKDTGLDILTTATPMAVTIKAIMATTADQAIMAEQKMRLLKIFLVKISKRAKKMSLKKLKRWGQQVLMADDQATMAELQTLLNSR